MGRLNTHSCLLCGYNSTEKLTFSTFPSNKFRRTLWLEKCGLDSDTDVSKARLCSKHFKEEDYNEGKIRRQLKNTALPSLLLVRDTSPKRKVVESSSSRSHKKCLLCDKKITGRSCSTIPKNEIKRWEWFERLGIDPTDSRLHPDARVCDDHITGKQATVHLRRRDYVFLTESGCANTGENESLEEPALANSSEFNQAMDADHDPKTNSANTNKNNTSEEPQCMDLSELSRVTDVDRVPKNFTSLEACKSMKRNFNNESVMKGVADASTQTDMAAATLVGIDNTPPGSPSATGMSSINATPPTGMNAHLLETPKRSKHARIFKVYPNDVKTPDILRTTPRTQSILRMYRSRVNDQNKKVARLQQQVRRYDKKIKKLQQILANLSSQNLLAEDQRDQLVVLSQC